MFVTAVVNPVVNPNNTRGSYGLQAYVNGVLGPNNGYYGYMGSPVAVAVSFMVPAGATYQVNDYSSFGGSVGAWTETY